MSALPCGELVSRAGWRGDRFGILKPRTNDPFLRVASPPVGKNAKLRGRWSTERERGNKGRHLAVSGRLPARAAVLGTGESERERMIVSDWGRPVMNEVRVRELTKMYGPKTLHCQM